MTVSLLLKELIFDFDFSVKGLHALRAKMAPFEIGLSFHIL